MIEFWGDDGHVVAVQLFSRKKARPTEASPKAESSSKVSTSSSPDELQARMERGLDLEELQTLIDVGKGKRTLWEVAHDPVYKPYLLQADLLGSANWEDKKKLKGLYKQALRAWMKQNRASKSRRQSSVPDK